MLAERGCDDIASLVNTQKYRGTVEPITHGMMKSMLAPGYSPTRKDPHLGTADALVAIVHSSLARARYWKT